MIVVDVETTGLDPKKHSIVSIGAVDFENPNYQFYMECHAWDGAEISKSALDVNGFGEGDVIGASKISLEDAIEDFIEWADGCVDKTLAGVNPSFDRDFLKESAEKAGIKWDFAYRTVDLHSICFSHYLSREVGVPMKNSHTGITSDKTYEYVGLPDEPKPHNALTGAKMESEAFSRLIKGKNLLEEYAGYCIPEYLKKA